MSKESLIPLAILIIMWGDMLTDENAVQPREITKDCDTGIEHAWFDYYSGIHLAEQFGWKQTTSIAELEKVGNFIVCCGEVGIRIVPADFSHMERRIF